MWALCVGDATAFRERRFYLFVWHSKMSVLPAAIPMLSPLCPNVQTPVQAVLPPHRQAAASCLTIYWHTHTHTCRQNSEILGPCAEFQIEMKGKEGKLCCAFIEAFISNLNIFYQIYSFAIQLFGLALPVHSRKKSASTVHLSLTTCGI